MRTLEAKVKCSQDGIAPKCFCVAAFFGLLLHCRVSVDQRFAFGFKELQVLPGFLHVRGFEVINGKLQLLGEAHIAVGNRLAVWASRPDDVINTIHVLEERCQAFESVRQLG